MTTINFAYEEVGGWTASYASSLIPALQEMDGVEVNPVKFEEGATTEDIEHELEMAPWCNWWLSSVLMERFLPEILDRADALCEKVAAHAHGGFETDAFSTMRIPGLNADDQYTLMDATDLVLVNSQWHKSRILERVRTAGPVAVVGHPLTIHGLNESEAANKRILVPAALCQEKQPILAAQILAPFKDQVAFCTSVFKEEHQEYARVLRAMGYEVAVWDKAEYHTQLYAAEIVFTASYTDTFNTSIAEGMMIGCHPVAPDLGVFQELVPEAFRYAPFDFEAARDMVRFILMLAEKPFSWGLEHRFTPAVVAKNIVKAMETCPSR